MHRLLFIIGFFYAGCSLAQITPSFNIFSSREGLSNNQVNAILKDQRGYLWVGTAEGLNRFDGHRFRQYFDDKEDKNTVNGNYILDLLEYQPGKLLIATNNGLSVLNTVTNTFQNELPGDSLLHKGHGTLVSCLFKDRQNRIWVNYDGVVDILDENLKSLFRLTDQPWAASLKGIKVFYEKVYQDKQGLIWLPSDNNGICIVDEEKKTVYDWNNNPLNYPFMKKGAVRSFYFDESSGNVWYGYWGNGLQSFNIHSGQHQAQGFSIRYQSEANCINSITPLGNGTLLCAGGNAVYRVSTTDLSYTDLSDPAVRSALPEGFSSICSLHDDLGNTWVGTGTLGLLQLPAIDPAVKQFRLPGEKLLSGYDAFCADAVQNGKYCYIAYRLDGILELNTITGNMEFYKIHAPQGYLLEALRLAKLDSTHIWIGTGAGVYDFNTLTRELSFAKELPSFTRTLHIRCMNRDRAGNIWLSFINPNALGCYNKTEGRFYFYNYATANSGTPIPQNYKITTIKSDNGGNVWMASAFNGGIYCYHPSARQWEQFPKQGSKNLPFFSTHGVQDFSPGSEQTLWISFNPGNGLTRFDLNKDSLFFYEHKNGLLSDNISSIAADKTGNLFLQSANGINYYHTKTGETQTRIFNNAEKNWSSLYNQFYDPDNEQLLYGVSNKILLIRNNFLETDTQRIRVYVENINVKGTSNYVYTPGQPIQLDHTGSDISIELTAPDFSGVGDVKVAYMMKGVDKDWIMADGFHTIYYKRIPPGNYTFLAKATRHPGEWGPVEDSLLITVSPSFWETGWFRLAGILLIAAVIFLGVQLRIRSLKNKAAIKHRMAVTEMAALQAQMNPHFIFNCLNAIDNLIQTNQSEKATTYLARFARLIRSVLDGAKNNVVPFQQDFESIGLYLQMEQFRSNNKFSFEMKVADELMHSDYKIPPMVIQPFVENAIIHGLLNKQEGERNLVIHADIENDQIVYRITDNGVGREKAQAIKQLNRPEHQSEGIRISKERIQLFSANGREDSVTIHDRMQDGKPAGTEVIVRISAK